MGSLAKYKWVDMGSILASLTVLRRETLLTTLSPQTIGTIFQNKL